MNRRLARMITGIIPNKKLRHKMRHSLIYLPEKQERQAKEQAARNADNQYFKQVFERLKVKSLHEYINDFKCIEKILNTLTPYDVVDGTKVRIGGDEDGGYVMLDPGFGGIAYSIGVSDFSPWDLEMAQRDFNVYQFDGTIDAPPDIHPNLHFQKVNILASATVTPGTKSLEQLFSELGHMDERDIILEIDIEGYEWDIFNNISKKDIDKFKQIIIEWHGLTPNNPNVDGCIEILKKVNETHKPVHVHLNNFSDPSILDQGYLSYSPSYEVSYVRIRDHEFTPCEDEFPTSLDRPNNPGRPDIKIGRWTV